jgi:hypothetical protein
LAFPFGYLIKTDLIKTPRSNIVIAHYTTFELKCKAFNFGTLQNFA